MNSSSIMRNVSLINKRQVKIIFRFFKVFRERIEFLAMTESLVVERYNYASFDCAARILATSTGAKSAWAILQPQNRDSYLKFLCTSPSKYVIVELCADIRLDTIVLANSEYFSSVFKDFRVWGGKKFPVDDEWLELGSFTAANTRQEQHFIIQKATSGYIRFLKIEFLSHYGTEYICPVSLIKAFGKTMMEDFVDEKRIADDSPALILQAPSMPPTSLLFDPKVPLLEECKVRQENVFKAINERLNAFERQLLLLGRERNRSQLRHELVPSQNTIRSPIPMYLLYASFLISFLSLIVALYSRRQQRMTPKKERVAFTEVSPSTPSGIILDDSLPDLIHNLNSPPLASNLTPKSKHKIHKST